MSTAYLNAILSQNRVFLNDQSPAAKAANKIAPLIRTWGNGYVDNLSLSGSYAKGTAVPGGTDVDLFISLSSTLTESLSSIYNKLYNHMIQNGYPSAKRQNVSIGIKVDGMHVDLVPARQQDVNSSDHSLWRRRVGNWTKTNVLTHIRVVSGSGRLSEIRLMKIWRNQKNLDLPSFLLELIVIEALSANSTVANGGDLSANIVTVLQFLSKKIETCRIVDPANTNNVISDDLTAAEKKVIAQAATRSLAGGWSDFIS